MRVPADDSEAWDQEDAQTPERRHAPQQKPHSVMDVQTIARCLPLMLCLVALTLIGIALQGGARSGEEVRAWQDQAHCAPSQAHCSPPPPAHRGGGPPPLLALPERVVGLLQRLGQHLRLGAANHHQPHGAVAQPPRLRRHQRQ